MFLAKELLSGHTQRIPAGGNASTSEGETPMQVTPLLKQKEVATWTGMSEAWLEQSRFKGIGIPYIKIGRAVRYRTEDVQRWIESHYVAAGI